MDLELEGMERQASSERNSPQNVKSPVRIINSSPIREPRPVASLSDYSSPIKGVKSISSFFTPPVIQNFAGSSLKNSPVKTTEVSPVKANESPVKANESIKPQSPVKPAISPVKSVSVSPQKPRIIEDSGSDLTISDDEEEDVKLSDSESELKFKPSVAKPVSFRSSSSKYSDASEDESDKEESEPKRLKPTVRSNSESESSEISVIISLPSTDSIDKMDIKPVIKKFGDFSNSEYESFDEEETEKDKEADEIRNIPIFMESDKEDSRPIRPAETTEIPLMVFNPQTESPQRKASIDAISSPEIKTFSTEALPGKQPNMPEKIPEKPAATSVRDLNLDALKASCKQAIADIERKRGAPMTEQEIHRLLMSSIPVKQAQSLQKPQLKPPQRPPVTVISDKSRAELARKLLLQNSARTVAPVATQPPVPPKPMMSSFTMPPPPSRVTVLEPPVQMPVNQVNQLNQQKHQLSTAPLYKTGFVYDERMLSHFDPYDHEHPEKPARITSIYEKLRAANLLDRSHRIPVQVKPAEITPDVRSIHSVNYCRKVNQTTLIRNLDELQHISSQYNSVYFNPSTAVAATVAAAATIELCDAIGRGEIENGFAIVRPPGHHAEHDEAMGFCIYNNVAVAASSLLRKKLAKRILILDWDVHHGNGTQNAFAESEDVLYVSLHRFDGGKFYPHIEEANHTYIGTGAGLGKTVNVAWNGPGFGDADYLFAFSRLIMPIAREFNPDFVIVSAGFDAAAGDPIGECELTTYGYSIMLQELMTLAGGRVALVLEGGYNLEVISKCYEACVRMLLKDAPPRCDEPMIASPKAILAVENCVMSQAPYWKCLFPKPAQLPVNNNTTQFSLPVILDYFWWEECKKHFGMAPIPGLFLGALAPYAQKYSNRILASEGALFCPETLIIFAHESGPIHTDSFISNLCLQSSKISQSQPFWQLLQAFYDRPDCSFIDICVPTRTWKLKQTALSNEAENNELIDIFTMLWERFITRCGCKNVFFVGAGSPIYSIGNLVNTQDVEGIVKGCYFFSSTLFIPVVNSTPSRSEWYQRNSQVIVPSQQPIKTAITGTPTTFGSCFSAGQYLMADSAAAVGDFKMEILNFIRTRLQKQ